MNRPQPRQVPVAIIGIGCIFAKSPDLKSFYHLITQGVDGITDPPETHRHLHDYFDPDPKKPDHIYCNRGGFLPAIEFDPTEFSIPPNAIEATDTSQLLGLVAAKRALADAGYGDHGKSFDRDKASVILGVTGTQELVIPLGARLGHPIWRRALEQSGVPGEQAEEVIQRISDDYVSWQENSFPGLLGNVVAGRIANRLDFGGTNCVVDAACASSFGALHMALLELRSGRSAMVLTGGVDTINDAFMHMCFAKTQILSPTGDVRPFSARADGTVLGEGIGLVVLKRLADAEKDGDRIYAVIKGLGSASDGNSQSIYAPRVSGQAKALRRAYGDAEIDPASVSLVEGHGTGTQVGDQVEFQALRKIFGEQSRNGDRCALGSVKSNIGHTKAAAGTAGLIKAALSLYHKVLPPTLKVDAADPKLEVETSPFYINTRLRPWLCPEDTKRRAGVSAFGFGGSNFHAVLEEHQHAKTETSWDGSIDIAAFSGDDDSVLHDQLERFTAQVLERPGIYKIGKLAKLSRKTFDGQAPCRMIVVLDLTDGYARMAQTCEDAARQLTNPNAKTHPSIFIGRGRPAGGLAFLFPGQGSQYTGMGRDVVCGFPSSFEALRAAAACFDGGQRLVDLIYPQPSLDQPAAEEQLRQTDVAQPAIGAVSVALLNALASFGVEHEATCGHSYGELVALYAASWMTGEELWTLSATRGRLMAAAGNGDGREGTMLAVKAPIEEVDALVQTLDAEIVLANRNSASQAVLSGSLTAIEAAEKACATNDWPVTRLPVAAAFHSPLVAQARQPFTQAVSGIQFTPGAIEVMSNTRGAAYPKQSDEIQTILGSQLAEPVNFKDNINALYEQGIRTFVEVGPKSVLTRLADECLEGKAAHTMSMDRSAGRRSGIEDLAAVLANLAALGHTVALDRWEKPISNHRKARMAINLSGANYRQPQAAWPDKNRSGRPHVPADREVDGVKVKPSPAQTNRRLIDQTPLMSVRSEPPAPYGGTDQADGRLRSRREPVAASALTSVQQGLESIQALQAQTSRAHEKFLETQAEASRTLQQMIQGIRQLALPNGEFETQTIATPPPAPAEPPKQPSTGLHNAPVVEHTVPVTLDPIDKPTTKNTSDIAAIEKTILKIVSELTGYPGEMLGLDMDIEADLGIDSIKRVEILSALEEQMPELAKVTPDMMGSLKTLGQICDYLSAGEAQPAASGEPADAPPQADSRDQAVSQALIAIVSELTGYPGEMLGLDMDIEADLGIDSIKRVEILSALEEQMPELAKVTPDMVGSLQTLGQICDYLNGAASETGATTQTTSTANISATQSDAGLNPALGRQVLTTVKLPPSEAGQLDIPDNSRVIVAGGSQSLADALTRILAAMGIAARHLAEPAEVEPEVPLAGIILLAPLSAQTAFQWAQVCHPHLMRTVGPRKPFVVTASFLDGAFGLAKASIENPEQGGLAGLVKTAAIEWPQVRCLALDIDPQWRDAQAVARAMVAEISIAHEHAELEIGLSIDSRVALRLMADPIKNEALRLDLPAQGVVVITGGARGVTAAAALSLAEHTSCGLALLGRFPEPTPEPAWLRPLTTESDIKMAILENVFQGQAPAPREVEAMHSRLMANRQIAATIKALKQRGARVAYYSVDVRDAAAVDRCLETVRRQLGPVNGIIHGAGVVEDRLIVDKTPEQYLKVYATKVEGVYALLKAVRNDDLKYLVLFSSMSARMGNQGQVDYAMANEALNKIARQKAAQLKSCKVVSINWGPWDGGMVGPGLRRNFLNNGVELIPLQAGARAMVTEMFAPEADAVEVVIGASLPKAQQVDETSAATALMADDLCPTFKHKVNVKQYPVLQSHLLNGRPVVPLALITEWLAHSAMHDNPGLSLLGIDDLRLLKGIVLDSDDKQVRMLAGKAERKGRNFSVDVQIRDAGTKGPSVVHASARTILTDRRLPSPPAFRANGHLDADGSSPSLSDIYDQVLFHGEDLRGIQEILRLRDDGMSARLAGAPPPSSWAEAPLRSRWIADPLVLDCAFQMAIIWSHARLGQPCLPSYAASYRQYAHRFPKEGVTAVLAVQKHDDHKLVGNFTFLNSHLEIVAALEGYEAIMDPLLVNAFKAA